MTKLAKRSWDKSGFAKGVGAVSEGCGTVRWFGPMSMKGKGTASGVRVDCWFWRRISWLSNSDWKS